MELYTNIVKQSTPAGQVDSPEALAAHVQWLVSVVPPSLTDARAKFMSEHPVLAFMPLVQYVIDFFVNLLETTVHGFPNDAQQSLDRQLATATSDSDGSQSDYDGIHGGLGDGEGS
eukprot:5085157-Alexandrium_andersonii.AAC.1